MNYLEVHPSPYPLLKFNSYTFCDIPSTSYDLFICGNSVNELKFEEELFDKYPQLHGFVFEGNRQNIPKNKYTTRALFPQKDYWIPIIDQRNEWIQIGDLEHYPGSRHTIHYGEAVWGYDLRCAHTRKYIGIYTPDFELIENPNLLTWDEAYVKFHNEFSRLPTEKEVLEEILPQCRLPMIRKNITDYESEKTTDLKYIFQSPHYHNLFLKLHLEEREKGFFENLTEDEIKKIKQIIIEFYNEEETYVLEKLMKTHLLVHLEVNPKYPMKKKNGVDVPSRFVCTYIRKE